MDGEGIRYRSFVLRPGLQKQQFQENAVVPGGYGGFFQALQEVECRIGGSAYHPLRLLQQVVHGYFRPFYTGSDCQQQRYKQIQGFTHILSDCLYISAKLKLGAKINDSGYNDKYLAKRIRQYRNTCCQVFE